MKKQNENFRIEDNVLFIHPGIRLNQSDVLSLMRGEKLPKYSINVTLNGYYLFNTEAGRIESTANFKRTMNVLLKKFPASENYNISVMIDNGHEKKSLDTSKDVENYLKDLFS